MRANGKRDGTSGGLKIPRFETGLPRLDAVLGGGLLRRSVTFIGGPPGAGKTILAQQICFGQRSGGRVLYFNTLSEPTAKTLLYIAQFAFFDAAKLETHVEFIDLGNVARTGGLEETAEQITAHIERVRPSIVVVDGFRVFDELARSREDLRRFGYELAVKLMVWDCTSLLVGAYGRHELESNPLFSIVDGLILLRERRIPGGHQRALEVVKMRGTAHGRDAHPFVITRNGIEILAPTSARKRARGTRTPKH